MDRLVILNRHFEGSMDDEQGSGTSETGVQRKE